MRSFYCKNRQASDLKDSILKANFCHFAKKKKCVCSISEVSFAMGQYSKDSETLILVFEGLHTILISLGDLDIVLSRACKFCL